MTTENTEREVKVTPCTGDWPLYQMYPQQCNPQDAYIELNPEKAELSADWSGEVGNSIPESVFHGTILRYSVSEYLHTSEVNALMEEIVPLAQRVCNGYEEMWNDHNHVGKLNDDASEAHEEIAKICSEAEACDSLHDGTEPWYDQQKYIILCHGRGDYITSLNDKGEVGGGSAEDAIEYTEDEACKVVSWLGSKQFSMERSRN